MKLATARKQLVRFPDILSPPPAFSQAKLPTTQVQASVTLVDDLQHVSAFKNKVQSGFNWLKIETSNYFASA